MGLSCMLMSNRFKKLSDQNETEYCWLVHSKGGKRISFRSTLMAPRLPLQKNRAQIGMSNDRRYDRFEATCGSGAKMVLGLSF